MSITRGRPGWAGDFVDRGFTIDLVDQTGPPANSQIG